MKSVQKTVQVYLDGPVPGQPFAMGELHAQSSSGSEIFSFEYDSAWLKREETFEFDPDLQLVTGPQYPAQTRNNFGIFLDSAPDR